MKVFTIALTCVLVTGLMLTSSTVYSQSPANDECSGATVISTLPYSTGQNTRLATANGSDLLAFCGDTAGGKSVWYTWTADSSGYVTFTTAGSGPTATYDTYIGLFTGACGALTLVNCNDDITPGSNRSSEVTQLVTNGTTYRLMIADWHGNTRPPAEIGGDMILNVKWDSLKPLYKGPKSGMVLSGATVSTNSFENVPLAIPRITEEEAEESEYEKREAAENHEQVLLPTPADVMPPLGPAGSNLKQYRNIDGIQTPPSRPAVLKNFQGNTATGAIPPDPILAVGPNHVIGAVNSSFRIWDKNGTLLKDIQMSSWYASVKSPAGFSDPQLLYDHYAGRWIIAGGGFSAPYAFLFSVSDDDNPLGTWTNWSLPGGLGDSVTGNLPDYPQIGYDEQAIYITSREFNPGFLYSRVRIIPKAQLYEINPDTVKWKDIWDLREPDHRSVALDGIRPSIQYGTPGVHFMVNAAPYTNGTFFTVWTISDPIGSPSITGVNVPVVQYSSAPQPSQLGGGTAIEGGGSAIRHKAVYRDSSLWMAHSVASGPSNAYSAVHYVRINPFTGTNIEDAAMGVDGFWHYYPALMVDAEKNVIVTFSRSGLTEYPGAFVAGRRNSEPVGLSPSVAVKAGLGNYDLVGGGRNRWGDYMGAGLDPVDSLAVWVNTEFATAGNSWSTWVAKIKMAPVPGASIFADPTILKFATREVGKTSDTLSVKMTSLGVDSLHISGLTLSDTNFIFVNPPSLPISLGTYDTAVVRLAMTPKSAGLLTGILTIASNDTNNPSLQVNLSGRGYIIHPVAPGVVYATTAAPDLDSTLYSVNTSTGALTQIGKTGYGRIVSARVHPLSGELMGIATTGAVNTLVRINATGGDAYPVFPLPSFVFMKGMAFRGDTLYIGRVNGSIYRINMTTGASTLVVNTGLNLTSLDFNPLTGQLWASECQFGGCSPNRIFKVNLSTGATTLVGSTGQFQPTLDLMFDGAGILYGTVGVNSSLCTLVRIDTSNGAATVVGSMGRKSIQALATLPDKLIGSLAFGFLEVDSSRTDTISVANGGGSPLSIPSISSNSGQFSVSPSSATIPPSSAQDFSVTFAPTSIGRKEGRIIFAYDTTGPRGVVTVSGTGAVTTSSGVIVRNRWNMLSVPLLVSDYRKTTLFSAATTAAFAYQGGYVSRDTLANALGYWMRFGADATVTIPGFLGLSDTIPVTPGWNLMGSVTDPAPTSSIVPIGTALTSAIYGFRGVYFEADSIVPGEAYWVKTSTGGKLALVTSTAMPRAVSLVHGELSKDGFSVFTVRNRAGLTQQLYTGGQAKDAPSAEHFELPPAPPEGAFDVRYASNRFLELHDNVPGSPAEFPIIIRSPGGAVSIAWSVARKASTRYSLVITNTRTELVSTRRLKGDGAVTLGEDEITGLKLRVEESLIPTEFALQQNYPNPFNPTTVIHYQLPSDEHVSLVVYDMLGQEVAALVNDDQDAGYYEVSFSADRFASGVYFYRLVAGTFTSVQKMLLTK